MRTATIFPTSSNAVARPWAVKARSPAARIVTAARGSARSRARDSRRGASPTRISCGPARRISETGIACGASPWVTSVATVPSGHSGSASMAATLARGFALEQAVGPFELIDGRLGDRRRADVAVDARVDDAVLLPRAAGDRAHEVAALLAQALALLVGGLPRGARGGRRGRRGGR